MRPPPTPPRAALLLLLLLPLLLTCATARAEFALRDGDVVAFLGDSITAEGTYGRMVETYALLRFPDRKVRFINAGVGGDTAEGGAKRLKRDVLDRGATVVTVAFGINDIGWGGRADEAHKQKYLAGVRSIVEQCRAANVRVFVCSAAVTGADPDKSEDDFLQRMCDEGMALSENLGGGAIDVQRTMRDIQRRVKQHNAGEPDAKKHESLHTADGIHLTPLGELAMGFAILKGLGAPADVSSVEINADGSVGKTADCKATGAKASGGTLEFTRLDAGLPLNFGLFGALHHRFIPIPEELNRYLLTVKGLKPGKYALTVDGRGVGTFGHDQLAAGVNLSSSTADPWVPGGPWEAQAWVVNHLTLGRFEADVQPGKVTGDYFRANPNRDALERDLKAVDDAIVAAQRRAAKPVPYRYVLKPAP